MTLPPDLADAVFSISTSIVIDAPRSKVWKMMTDFPSVNQWNPFIRSLTVTDRQRQRLADQRPKYGHYIVMDVHIPPCMDDNLNRPPSPSSSPSSSSSSSSSLSSSSPPSSSPPRKFGRLTTRTTSFERITSVDSHNYKIAWTYPAAPTVFVRAERWQWLTPVFVDPEDDDDDDPESSQSQSAAAVGEDGRPRPDGAHNIDIREERRRKRSRSRRRDGAGRMLKERTRYETCIAFYGVLSYGTKWFLRKGLEEGFDAMAKALKARCEEGGGGGD